MWILVAAFLSPVAAQENEIAFRLPDSSYSIAVSAPQGITWDEGGFKIVHLPQGIQIRQGHLIASAREALLFIQDIPDVEIAHRKLIAYLEGDVVVEMAAGNPVAGEPTDDPSKQAAAALPNRIVDQQWLGRLFTEQEMRLEINSLEPLATNAPEIYGRARTALLQGTSSGVQPAQFQEPAPGSQVLVSPLTGQIQTIPPPQVPAEVFRQSIPSGGTANGNLQTSPNSIDRGISTRVDIAARDFAVDFNLKIQTNPDNPNERVWLGSGGARVTIDSPEIADMNELQIDQGRQVVILADNVVAWQTTLDNGDSRWEIYLEGNVVFSKGTRTIYADQFFYNANEQRGTILNADMLTPISRYRGLVRLKADVIQQLDANTLQAFGAAFTSSRLGVPRYWLQSSGLQINREQILDRDPNSGMPLVDTYSGQPQLRDEYFADSRNNFVYLADWPVFYWPRFRTSLSDPTLYLERLRFGNDRIFGFQAYTGWNMYQILGLRNRPENSRWLGELDYLSDRGLGLGSEVDYQREELFGIPGSISGMTRSWFIRDQGVDNLGRGRSNLDPEEETRGRMLARHRQEFNSGLILRGELGYLSDRNFLEQYFERSWDSDKDYTTGIWLERNLGAHSFNLLADAQINRFFTQTSWLPKLDHFGLGQPLFSDRVVWYSHTQIGYGRLRTASDPLNASELATFNTLPWEADVDGVRLGTRHEIDVPFQLGPVKLVPYVLGDLTYWQEDLSANDLTRGYGQAGIRASVPFWRVDPTIQSTLWNVNGLAHKVSLDTELLCADSNRNMSDLAFYDPLDDDAQEAFRHRLASTTFGIPPPGDVPLAFDERFFAFRRGMQSWVTAASTEVAEDLAAVKLGLRQRWQTKRGLPGDERIIDWITLDTQTVYFPDSDRDNFGADWGLMDYDFQWHVGDRLSLVSDGYFDFFSQGLRTASVGMYMSRPEIGNLYVGYRSIEGPFSSNIVSATAVYRMSDKWGIKAGTAIDFGSTGTIGQSLSLIYIGESFLWRFGVNADASRGNVGFQFGLEPRFLPKQRMFLPGGVAVFPAGSRWLE